MSKKPGMSGQYTILAPVEKPSSAAPHHDRKPDARGSYMKDRIMQFMFSVLSRTSLLTVPLLLAGCLTVPEKPTVEPGAEAFETPGTKRKKAWL